jgi:hypothetical protein
VPITTKTVSSNPVHGEVYGKQYILKYLETSAGQECIRNNWRVVLHSQINQKNNTNVYTCSICWVSDVSRGRRVLDHMVVGFTTTHSVSSDQH